MVTQNYNSKQVVSLGMWIVYVWMKTMAGLAIHPYKSIRRMVFTDRILLPVVVSPMLGLVLLLVVGRVGSRVITLSGLWREGMATLLGSTLIGLVMWQLLLLGLVVRFRRAS